jgi:hypothetical protein
MTNEEWWSTPFLYRATISSVDFHAAQDWLEENGYVEWRDWNSLYVGGRYRFEFLNKDVHALFALRWV